MIEKTSTTGLSKITKENVFAYDMLCHNYFMTMFRLGETTWRARMEFWSKEWPV